MSIFVDHSTRHLRERDVKVRFGNPFNFGKESVTITHEYSDNTSINIYVDLRSIDISFEHYHRHYHHMRVRIPFECNDTHHFDFDYDPDCTGRCGGCSNMHECHDLG